MELRRVEKVVIARPVSEVLPLLWDVNNLPKYGPRVDLIRVNADSPYSGTYCVRGNLGGTPWTGTFIYRLTEDGFDSHLIEGPIGMRAKIRVKVRAQSRGRSIITHVERYEIPVPEFPLLEWGRRLGEERVSAEGEMRRGSGTPLPGSSPGHAA